MTATAKAPVTFGHTSSWKESRLFRLVGLKFGSENRRAAEGRPYEIGGAFRSFVGAGLCPGPLSRKLLPNRRTQRPVPTAMTTQKARFGNPGAEIGLQLA